MAYVYVLRSGNEDLFKIGRTRDLDSRLENLATGNPHRLSVFAVIETDDAAFCEAYLHRKLRSKRVAREFFATTTIELEAAIREARAFLVEFVATRQETERLAQEESNGRLLTPGPVEWSIYRDLLETREKEDRYKYRRELLENKLKLAIGGADGLEGLATWKTESRELFDQASFKRDQPDVFLSYVRIARPRILRLSHLVPCWTS
jgi:hypothetical protein